MFNNLKTNNQISNYNHSNNWRKLALFLTLYFMIWSIVPGLINSSPALDVSEGINWGSEWQWGYYKHPPFSSWILFGFYKIFGHFGPYLLSQICVFSTLVLVYQLGNYLFGHTKALLAALFSLAIFYYTYPTLEFNHNIAQFPIWAGLSLLFYQATTLNRYRDWILLGVVGGIGMLTKYSVAFLLIPMALYLLLPNQWRLLKQPKPWVSAALMLIIFFPHLLWLFNNDWLPFTYASGRSFDSTQGRSLAAHFSWFNFSLAQLVAHLPFIIMLLLLRHHFKLKKLIEFSPKKTSTYQPKLKKYTLLKYLWLSPLLFLVFLSLIFGVGLRDMWGMPMWSLSGLVIISVLRPYSVTRVKNKLTTYIMTWLILITVLMVVYLQFGHSLRDKPSRMDWPEKALSLQAQKTWHGISTCAWDSLSGDRWLTALVAMNAKSSPFESTTKWPSLMISGPASHSPWMSETRLLQHGTLIMTQPDHQLVLPLIEQLPKDKMAYYEGTWQLKWPKNSDADPLIVNWSAYVPYDCMK